MQSDRLAAHPDVDTKVVSHRLLLSLSQQTAVALPAWQFYSG